MRRKTLILLSFMLISVFVFGQGLSEQKEQVQDVMNDDLGEIKREEVLRRAEKEEVSVEEVLTPRKDALTKYTAEKRRYPYNEHKKKRRDPLTIPWVQKDVDAQNLFNEGLNYKNKGNITKAIATFRKLLNAFGDTSWAAKAREELGKLEKLTGIPGKGPGATGSEHIEVVLPNELRAQLKGILWSDADPMMIWADRLLREGDVIPEFKATVIKINQSEVVYLYQKTFFKVPLMGRE